MKAIGLASGIVAAAVLLAAGSDASAAPIVWDGGTMSVSASSEFKPEYAVTNTVDESGLSPAGTHSTDGNDMWMGVAGDVPDAWVEFDLGAVRTLSKARVWAYNRPGYTNRCMQQVDVRVSTDGGTWTTVAEDAIAPQSSGSSSYAGFGFELPPAGVPARYVRLEVDSNYGPDGYGNLVGLSEIRFYDTSDAGPQALLVDFGQSGMPYHGTDSPAHANGPVVGAYWSSVGSDTPPGGLQYCDGYLAPDVGVELGTETGANTGVIDWDGVVKRVNAGGSGIYATDLMADAVARDGAGSLAMAAKVTGLAPGEYELYVMARNPYDGGADDQEIYVGTISDPSEMTTDFSAFLAELIEDNTQTAWVDGDNYMHVPFTLGEGEALVVVADRINGSEVGILSGLAIVGPIEVIPEPCTAVLVGLSLPLLIGRCRRRYRR